MKVEIEVAYGYPDKDDIVAAEHAALAVLEKDPTAHEAAQQAADLALTKDWADPDGAGCYIHIYD